MDDVTAHTPAASVRGGKDDLNKGGKGESNRGTSSVANTADLNKTSSNVSELLAAIPEPTKKGQPQEEEEKHLKLVKPRHFDEYTYHIPRIELKSGVVVSQKLSYIMNEALSDLGLRNILSIDFWITLIILLLTLWIRAFLHTFGSWILLKFANASVNTFDPMMYFFSNKLIYYRYGFNLAYSTRNVGIIIGVIIMGNIFNILVFGVLAFLAWFVQRRIKKAPKLIYKFVAAYGISLIFDYLLIAIVDICKRVLL